MPRWVMPRREFSRLVLSGAATALGGQGRTPLRAKPAAFTEQLLRAATRLGTGGRVGDFYPTSDVSQRAKLPITGVHHHVWLGNAGQFRAEPNRVGGAVAGEVGKLLGTQAHWDRLVTLGAKFFGNRKLAPESPAVVLVCLGHVTTRHAFGQTSLRAENLTPAPGDVRTLPPPPGDRLALQFAGGWRGYGLGLDLPRGFRPPPGRPEPGLVRRHRLRVYRTGEGAELPARDFILQYGSADLDPHGADLRAIRAGEYYPNSQPFRRLFNEQGYTDSSSVVFIRTVGGPGGPHAHQVNLNFNLGMLRDRLGEEGKSNPEEVLDVNTVTRPLQRVFDQYPAQREALEAGVLRKLG